MSTLLIIDVQNDFCPGGALGVREGDQIIPLINKLRQRFTRIILTQDWHPENHLSFAVNHAGRSAGEVIDLDGVPQTLWPAHCVQGSTGAQFHKELIIFPSDIIFKKGTDPKVDSYSAFYDNARRKSTGLADYLHKVSARDVTLCGLATDYCVLYSALDALDEDLVVNVVPEACRAVNLNPGDGMAALEKMKAKGARLAPISKILE